MKKWIVAAVLGVVAARAQEAAVDPKKTQETTDPKKTQETAVERPMSTDAKERESYEKSWEIVMLKAQLQSERAQAAERAIQSEYNALMSKVCEGLHIKFEECQVNPRTKRVYRGLPPDQAGNPRPVPEGTPIPVQTPISIQKAEGVKP